MNRSPFRRHLPSHGTGAARPALLALAACVLLAACGGRHDDEPPAAEATPATVPSEARATAAAFTGWAAARTAEDRADPLRVDDFVPPTSDTDEPAPLR